MIRIILFLIISISCYGETPKLKEFMIGKFVMDADSSIQVFKTLPMIKKLKEVQKSKLIANIKSYSDKRFLEVTSDQLIFTKKSFVEYYKYKILDHKPNMIKVELKLVKEKERSTNVVTQKAGKPKISFFKFFQDKQLLWFTDEKELEYRVWKKVK